MRKTVFSLLLTLTILSGGFSIKPGRRPHTAIDSLHFHKIADMYKIPQNTSYYAKQIQPVSYSSQLNDARNYLKKFFAPWRFNSMKESRSALTWQIRMVQRRVVYGFDKRPIPKKLTRYWVKNSNFKALNSVKARAISVKHTNLHAFPSTRDIYLNPAKSTTYYPFDYNQNSELHPGVPLYLSHYSKDKKWAFVRAGHAFGWVKLKDIALVDSNFIKNYKTGSYAVTVKDNLYVYKNSSYYTLIKLGSIFPLKSDYILFPTRGDNGFAKIEHIKKPKNSLVAKFPVKFNSKNVAYIAQQFYNEPYGWGGKAFCRDCSATTRDFFAPFGVFLGRNSADQAHQGKRVINIKGLPKAVKKRVIIKYAKPFRSLLYVPGHITIYIGHYKNEPVVMHTYWGIRLNNWSKYTLSRTIITTTEPGKEHPNIRERSKLINTLQKIITF